MNLWKELLNNKLLISGALGWFTAQIIKIIIEAIKGKLTPDRITGSGGMPSTHCATVSALTTAALLTDGPGSGTFAVALFLSFIVMYDGMNVRYITGKQSAILNKMNHGHLPEKMGHTLAETIVGCLLGICIGLLVCLIILPQ